MLSGATLKHILQQYLTPHHLIILAVSGGPDSMCLLHLCLKNLPRKNIVVAHFEHGMRKESKRDQNVVKKYCEQHDLLFETASADIPAIARQKKMSPETAARLERYAFLRRVKEKHGAKYILTAHHRDDNVETILLHIIRGTGLHGLTGLQAQREDILRPLLSCSKAEILAYCHKHHILYCQDKTNFIPDTSRNLLRLQVIPLLKEINPNLEQTLLKNTSQFEDLEKYLQAEVATFLSRGKEVSFRSPSQNLDSRLRGNDKTQAEVPSPRGGGLGRGGRGMPIHFSQKEFSKLAPSLQRAVLQYLYEQAHGSTTELSFELLETVRDFVLHGKTGKQKMFGKKLNLENSYGDIFLKVSPKEESFPQVKQLKIPGTTTFGWYQIRTTINPIPLIKGGEGGCWNESRRKIRLSYDNLRAPLKVRNWQPGDTFHPFGMQGKKKLQDFFTDLKISPELRQSVPIITDARGHILAVYNLRIDDRVKVDAKTKQVLVLSFTFEKLPS